MHNYPFSKEDLENSFDVVKMLVLEKLVNEKLIAYKDAENFCENHTVIVRKKNFFRTLSNKWRKEKEEDWFAIVVKK